MRWIDEGRWIFYQLCHCSVAVFVVIDECYCLFGIDNIDENIICDGWVELIGID